MFKAESSNPYSDSESYVFCFCSLVGAEREGGGGGGGRGCLLCRLFTDNGSDL